ncbi:hypothetical protein B0H11DRAFT_1915282 [Mycena galericulata]|nr:hypothetical protein B0H11DRAFT_1915282 [Mycena galericulata]
MYVLSYRNRTLEMKEDFIRKFARVLCFATSSSHRCRAHRLAHWLVSVVELAVAAVVKYVYALDDFLPEREAEVSLHSGERIEVVEKDDLYGDGWWKGHNLAGKPFPEEPDSAAVSPVFPVPPIQLNDDEQDANTDLDGEVTKATMTDVQAAGSNTNIDQDAHNFSFASTRDDRTSDDEGDEFATKPTSLSKTGFEVTFGIYE